MQWSEVGLLLQQQSSLGRRGDGVHVQAPAPHNMANPVFQNCTNCHNICVETIAHCLQMGGKHVEAAHLKSLLDCADTCRISADFMLRGSAIYAQACGLCAEACARCAGDRPA